MAMPLLLVMTSTLGLPTRPLSYTACRDIAAVEQERPSQEERRIASAKASLHARGNGSVGLVRYAPGSPILYGQGKNSITWIPSDQRLQA
jgi:hypothetical protein